MDRARFLKLTFTLSAAICTPRSLFAMYNEGYVLRKRYRPGDPEWPSEKSWALLSGKIKGRLIKLTSPFKDCIGKTKNQACETLFDNIKNPYYIGDDPALTQISGWLNAWTASVSVYAVEAKDSGDVAAAVNFARTNNLRLVVKGGGHSYQGTSNAPDSLLVWTKAMNKVELHDAFMASGSNGREAPQRAVTIGAGAVWMQAYNAVSVKGGRYVQGGGCATVGVAGLIQSGGFGSYSKNYGLASASLLEAEIVTADGKILSVNPYQHPDLFWALKGGGGGSFGVVTKVTLKTHDLPTWFGAVSGTIRAQSGEAFKKLLEYFTAFYSEQLFNPHWGEQVRLYSDNRFVIDMSIINLELQQAKEIWKIFEDWVNTNKQDFTWEAPLNIALLPGKYMWNAEVIGKYAPSAIVHDDREGAPLENIFWSGDQEQASQFWYSYHSAWLPEKLLQKSEHESLSQALFAATRYWTVGLHFNKGMAGAQPSVIKNAQNTAMNPSVLQAFALAIIAGGTEEGPVFPGVSGHEPDLVTAKKNAGNIDKAMKELRKVAANTGSYVSESYFFESNWQESFWGKHYSRLSQIKEKYDPHGLFFVRHGVGSEGWSDDGFERI